MALQQRELELQEARRAIHVLEHRLADREAEIEALQRISEAAGSALASEISRTLTGNLRRWRRML